jgi:hypothetical protein
MSEAPRGGKDSRLDKDLLSPGRPQPADRDGSTRPAAAGSFRQIVAESPSDDYAQFGLGLSLARAGNPRAAAEHLALAAATRPDLRHYTDALRGVRATLRYRARGEGQN